MNITLKVDDVSRVGPLGQPWYTTFRKQGKQENSLRFCTCTLSTRCICFFYFYHRCAVLQLRCFCNDMLMGNWFKCPVSSMGIEPQTLNDLRKLQRINTSTTMYETRHLVMILHYNQYSNIKTRFADALDISRSCHSGDFWTTWVKNKK